MTDVFSPPLRVGYVTKMYPRYSETFIVNELLAHEAAGLSVEIFSLRTPSDPYFQDLISLVRSPVTQVPSHNSSTPSFWALLTQAAQVLPDFWQHLSGTAREGVNALDLHQAVHVALAVRERGIMHLHAHFASVGTTVARLAARFAGITYSFTAHAKDIYHDSVNHEDLIQKLSDASGVITVSDYNLAYLHTLAPLAASRAKRVYNGLDFSRLQYQEPGCRPPVIVGVGRLVEKKGFADLIMACRLLADRGVSFECRIVGRGELEQSLRSQIEALGMRNQVQLLGAMPQAEVLRVMQDAAVFALPCVVGEDGNRDGLPTVLLEAMALGTPCISTPVTGIPELIRHGDTGLVVPQRDPQALALSLEALLANAPLRARLARQAHELVTTEFDIHRNTAELRQMFTAAVGAT